METKKHLINPFLNKSTWHPNRMTSLIKNWHHFTLQSHYHEISNNLWRSRLFSCFAHIDNNVFACFFLVINMLIEQIQFNRVFQGQIEILNNFTKILIERNTLLNSIQKANISVRLRNSKKIKVKNLRSVRAKNISFDLQVDHKIDLFTYVHLRYWLQPIAHYKLPTALTWSIAWWFKSTKNLNLFTKMLGWIKLQDSMIWPL